MEQEINNLKERLQKQEKLASLGILSAGIAHEIQNPLNFVINFSKMSDKLLKDLTDIVEDNADNISEEDREDLEDIVADLKENMGKIVEHGERAISIIRGILLVSRGKENEYLPTDVCKLAKEYVWLSYHAMRANHKGFNASIHEQYEEGLPQMMVIPQDLSRAILNIMNNALYAVWKKSQALLRGNEGGCQRRAHDGHGRPSHYSVLFLHHPLPASPASPACSREKPSVPLEKSRNLFCYRSVIRLSITAN